MFYVIFVLLKKCRQEFEDFIKNENYWSGVMTSARIQRFCKKYDINIGCFDGKKLNPGNITQRNSSLIIYNDHFCLVRKSFGISFNQAIEEVKLKYKVFDNVLSDKHVKSFAKYEYNREIETYKKDRAVPSCSCYYKLSKVSDKYHRDITEKIYQKSSYDCVVSKGSGCSNEMLDHVLWFKGAAKK